MKLAIIGGGVSGLAAAYQASQDGLDFTLFEAGSHFGGVVETEIGHDGAVLEAGPEACLSSKPEMLALVRSLGLENEIIATRPDHVGSFIVRDGILHPIPQGLRLMAPTQWWPFFRSGLISFRGKLRALLDLGLPARVPALDGAEESLAEFVSRRLGVEVLHYLAQPMVAGIYGADPQVLSLEATMPFFPRLEQEHGSVIRGLRRMGGERDSVGARYSLFFSLKHGFGSVIEALVKALPASGLRLGARIDRLEFLDGPEARWRVTSRDEGDQIFDAVVVAVPAPVASNLLEPVDPKLGSALASIPTRPAVTVNLSYEAEVYDQFVPPSYGFVVPEREECPLMACTFSSHKWEGRGSPNRSVLRAYFGGPSGAWALRATDDDLVAVATSQLGELLGLDEPTLEASVRRFPVGLPEYRLGHRQLVSDLQERQIMYPGLALAGNYLEGVGMPDCVRSGRRAVTKLGSR